MGETVTITYKDKTIELPVVVGSEGEVAVDITRLRAETGIITLDPGYANTGSCTSAITFMDGEKGIFGIGVFPWAQSGLPAAGPDLLRKLSPCDV